MKKNAFELKLTVKDMIHNLVTRIEQIYQLFSNGSEAMANSRLVFWIDDIQMLMHGIVLLNEYQISDLNIDELNDKLNSIVRELEKKDYYFVSDLLMYDVKPLLEYWDGCLTND